MLNSIGLRNMLNRMCFFSSLTFQRPVRRPPQVCPSTGWDQSSSGDQRPLCGAQAAAWRLDSRQRFAGDEHKAEQNNKYYQPRLFKGISSSGERENLAPCSSESVEECRFVQECSSTRFVCLEGSEHSWCAHVRVCMTKMLALRSFFWLQKQQIGQNSHQSRQRKTVPLSWRVVDLQAGRWLCWSSHPGRRPKQKWEHDRHQLISTSCINVDEAEGLLCGLFSPRTQIY